MKLNTMAVVDSTPATAGWRCPLASPGMGDALHPWAGRAPVDRAQAPSFMHRPNGAHITQGGREGKARAHTRAPMHTAQSMHAHYSS